MANGFWQDRNSRLMVGIGSVLVDILVPVSDAFVARTGVPKGGMVYFDADTIQNVLQRADGDARVVPGGAACNTILGAANLGGKTRFLGKCGQDDFGHLFERDLNRHRVEPFLMPAATPTGRVLSLITPDSQRTMLTYLGASAEMTPAEIPANAFEGAAVALVEGYLIYNRDLFLHALQRAREAGAKIVLDLASFTVVEENMDLLAAVLEEYVNIVIANEDEARTFTGCRNETDALAALASKVEMAVLKKGARGSIVATQDCVYSIEPIYAADVIDTTGAGDLWAAGFLYGLMEGKPIEQCGRLASVCGYEVCRVLGATIPETAWERIRKTIV
ncbi:MAG: adenosine kinase [Desulfobacterales bacterium]|jgi:sugar/nucleoside kinase (ribokinase family)